MLSFFDKIVKKIPFKVHGLVLFGLTAIMVLLNHYFHNAMLQEEMHVLYSNVQFDTEIPLFEEYKSSIQNWSYYLFFCVDFIWAALLLLMMYRVLCEIVTPYILRLITTLFILAYTADVVENVLYLLYEIESVIHVQRVKVLLYALSFVTFLFSVIIDHKKIVWRFIKHARISLVFIFIVSILIGFVDQGGDIMIRLFESRFNLIITLLLVYFVSIPTAHYPIYFKGSKYSDTNLYEYIMSSNFTIKSYIGIIYFVKRKGVSVVKNENDSDDKEEFKMQIFRRCLGVLFYVAFIYMILTAVDEAHSLRLATSVTFLIAVFLFCFVWYLSKLKLDADKYFEKEGEEQSGVESVKKFTKIIGLFPYLLMLDILMLVIVAFTASAWNKQLVFLIVVVTILAALTYVLLTVGRSYLKYIFTNKWTIFLLERPQEYFEEKRAKYYENYKGSYINFLSIFSNNSWYLFFIAVFGIICVSGILVLNFNWKLIHNFNPIPLFLMLYLFFYGAIIIYIKHFKYYTQMYRKTVRSGVKEGEFIRNENLDKEGGRLRWRLWIYHIPFTLLVLTLIGGYTSYKGNDLHELQTIKQDSIKGIEISAFVSDIKEKKEHYFVSSYGGGLKSNLWTMLLLNKLDNTNKKFLNNTRCLSGVSGGSVGIANYTYIKAFNKNKEKAINRLANLNGLSLDVLYLATGDLIREFIPKKFKGKDRSHFGMRQHILAIDKFKGKANDSFTFYDLYEKVYKEGYYPPLIINTTGTNNKYGNALSLKINGGSKIDVENYEDIFPGAINILNSEKGRELPFYTTVSTSNRFPFVSPAAKIKQKGYFLDGGAFENSGLLSAYSFKEYLEKVKVINDSATVKFINFINAKSNYIRHFAKENNIKVEKLNSSPELIAVLKVGVAIEHTPNYIKDVVNNKEETVDLYLPHYFTFKDLENVLGGKLQRDKDELIGIVRQINDSNKRVKEALRKQGYNIGERGIVQPATGRLLSTSSILYQKAMVNHHVEVKENIAKIFKKMNKEEK
ncbi:patatin-like phospholipase family protein [Tenacibaculum aiptasiae]|uniref:Patatin-like phospholipase family protein n=1 Tax=Tenacibaculum aiptasiae TaxID=426481 RepID=A0A7J5AAM2_9FLAO|nr:patatin-like phospholipase family protein [Tenacibaculum aiptasiae]KAB1154575.1 patatin-like phospholipase family protein [Tenacibaculum aiptasiae]